MKSHTASKEERAWMDAISEFGCAVCHREWGIWSPAEVHHLQGKVREGSHLLTIPLCQKHHRGGEDTTVYTSRHPYKSRFEERYGSEHEIHQWIARQIHNQQEGFFD